MDSVRGGLCQNFFAYVEGAGSGTQSVNETLTQTKIIDVWNQATLIFVQRPSFYPFLERGDKIIAHALGVDSPEELIVEKFWEAVYASRSPSSLVGKADELVAAVEKEVSGSLLKVLQTFEEVSLADKLHFLKIEVSHSLLAKIIDGSKQGKIIRDYAEYQVNLWIACQVALLGSDLLFENLDALKQNQIREYLAFQRPLIKDSISSLEKQLKEEKASGCKTAQEKANRIRSLRNQLLESQDELSQLYEQAERICGYPEIDALCTPIFRRQVREWQENIVAVWERIMKSAGEVPTLNWFLFLIQQAFQDQAEQIKDEEDWFISDELSPLMLQKQQAKNTLYWVKKSESWDEAFRTFMQNPDNRALSEKSEKAVVLAGFGKDSPQYKVVTQFWEMVNNSPEGISLIYRVEDIKNPLLRYAKLSLIEQIGPVVASLNSGERKTSSISEILDSLNQKVCRALGIKNTYESEQEKIIHEYVRFRVNLGLAFTLIGNKKDMVFTILTLERQVYREEYVIAHKAILSLPCAKTLGRFSEPDQNARAFFFAPETQERVAQLDREAQIVYKDTEEIDAFRLGMRTPFYRAATQLLETLSSSHGEFLTRDDLVQKLKQNVEEELKLFSPLPPKKATELILTYNLKTAVDQCL